MAKKSFKYKNWIYILDKKIEESIKNDSIELKLTTKQAIFFRECIQDCRSRKLESGEIEEQDANEVNDDGK